MTMSLCVEGEGNDTDPSSSAVIASADYGFHMTFARQPFFSCDVIERDARCSIASKQGSGAKAASEGWCL